MRKLSLLCVALFIFSALPSSCPAAAERTITDASGQRKTIPADISHVICSGSGCLRLLTYMQAQSMIVGVDDIETRRKRFEARPYALANPDFKKQPTFGEFRGHDNPERILALSPPPDIIFKTIASMGTNPEELAQKTGIPVIILDSGDLGEHRLAFYNALRIIGSVLGKEQRAETVISFFEKNIQQLGIRTANMSPDKKRSVFIGGVAFKGPHGFQSTEPDYPPFKFVGLRNIAYTTGINGKGLRHSDVAKEKLLEWDPNILFLDLSTLQFGKQGGGLNELKTDPAYQTLTAVQQGMVYGVLPYNGYSQNYGSILANAWFIGKMLYPEQFKDIDPAAKADAIYTFLVGKPVFEKMNAAFGNLVFSEISVR
ncbi:MAG: iron ABC transporter substrate-binding protein [Desulfoplanes sp.]|nr:iron ABC transporter substrate-binding protein [Desulfoplanes sp.]